MKSLLIKPITNPQFRPLLTVLYLAGGTILTTVASCVFRIPWLMPILGSGVIYPLFFLQIRHRQYNQALKWVLIWAILQSLSVITATIIAPEIASEVILSGTEYKQEMFHWIRTGKGTQGSFIAFLPLHLKEYILFSLLSLITLGSASLLLGTYLLNYMNFFVGSFILESSNPLLAALVSWFPWSILRVLGYICTGIALTDLGLNIIRKYKRDRNHISLPINYVFLGISFLLGDIILKAFFAPIWQKFFLYPLTINH